MSSGNKYAVVHGSMSCHCCFVATVVDTTAPVVAHDGSQLVVRGEPVFCSVCECLDIDDAQTVCDALNAAWLLTKED